MIAILVRHDDGRSDKQILRGYPPGVKVIRATKGNLTGMKFDAVVFDELVPECELAGSGGMK